MAHEQQYEGDDLHGDLDVEGAGGEEMVDAAAEQELEAMKARLADMEKEAAKLKEMQDKAQKEAGMAPAGTSADAAAKEEADGRSVYVGNVDYSCTPEELQMHFQSCGTVNRVTILTDKMGNPKGFAYIEFLEADAVTNACLLDGSELRNRAIKVAPKRTNVPGMKQGRGGRGRGRGGRGGYYGYGMMPMMPPPFMFGYGYPPYGGGRGRGRGRGGYQPY